MKKLILSLVLPLTLMASFSEEYYQIKDVKAMKAYFFDKIFVMAKNENEKIRNERKFIQENFEKLAVLDKESTEYKRFEQLRKKYKLKEGSSKEDFLLLIDEVPYSLVLAQAAIESGWGKSRFFKEANNIFGQWTWKGKGLTPKDRDAGKKHKIQIFDSLQDAIRSYLFNMNVGWGYKEFRKQRAQMRKDGLKLDGLSLSSTLINYSQKKEVYTALLHKFIRQNKLSKHDF